MNNLVIIPAVYEALNTLSKAMRRKILEAVMQYQFEGTEPTNLSTTARVIFRLILACSEQATKAMSAKSAEPNLGEESIEAEEATDVDSTENERENTIAEASEASETEVQTTGLSRSQRRRLRRRHGKLCK